MKSYYHRFLRWYWHGKSSFLMILGFNAVMGIGFGTFIFLSGANLPNSISAASITGTILCIPWIIFNNVGPYEE